MNRDAAIFVAGARGLVGSAIVRRLRAAGFRNLLIPAREDLDLTSQESVARFFSRNRPEQVFLAAAKVGGILANSTYPGEFLRDNLAIQTNVIHAAHENGTRKLLFLGSSCIYPKHAPQPMTEDCLLTGPLEPTNEWYAIAKIAGLKMCQAYRRQYGFNAIAAMPTNLYGPGDNFNLENSHVIPALIRRIHDAKERGEAAVEVWGTGTPRREFLYVDDLADACLFLMGSYDGEALVNIGWGRDTTIAELTTVISKVIGYEGVVRFDPSKPDGTPRKLLDTSRLSALGWMPRIGLTEGVRLTYEWFLQNARSLRV
jgi:GDP-L-fucose synthase